MSANRLIESCVGKEYYKNATGRKINNINEIVGSHYYCFELSDRNLYVLCITLNYYKAKCRYDDRFFGVYV